MPRWSGSDDDWEGEDDPSDDEDDEDEEDTRKCPCCRRDIHEESVRCPHCDEYVSSEEATQERKPWWVVIGVIVCLYIVYRWVVWF